MPVSAYTSAEELTSALVNLADEKTALHSQRFFKTNEGEYGAGDKFLGIRVPLLRGEAKNSLSLNNSDVCTLLRSPWHEVRLCALLIWVYQFPKADEHQRDKIVQLYLQNTEYINNWDLVDSSAHKILGAYLLNRSRQILFELAESSDLWERRIAIISTYHFIQNHDFGDTIALCEQLLKDEEDLIHKATGWMLREVGKRQPELSRTFLEQHAASMPRTMLRYVIEKFAPAERQYFMDKKANRRV